VWRMFQRDRGGSRSGIALAAEVLDLGLPAHATRRYVVRWPMEAPGASGMGEAAEAESMAPIEAALWEGVQDAGGVPVARVRGDGVWTFVAYGPELPWEALVGVASAMLGRPHETEQSDDPEAAWLNEHFAPTEEESSWMQSAEVVSQLVLMGVDLEVPTTIHHYVYAEQGGDLTAFAVTAPHGPFEVEMLPAEPEEGVPEGVRLSHRILPDMASLHPIVWDLTRAADAAGLLYDGWEAEVGEGGLSPLAALFAAAEAGEA